MSPPLNFLLRASIMVEARDGVLAWLVFLSDVVSPQFPDVEFAELYSKRARAKYKYLYIPFPDLFEVRRVL